MQYDVEREHGQYHVREKGQVSRGTTLTDGWLKQMGFWPLARSNIDSAIQATMASAGGMVLDRPASRRMPKDINFTASSRSYPRARIPERMLFRGNA